MESSSPQSPQRGRPAKPSVGGKAACRVAATTRGRAAVRSPVPTAVQAEGYQGPHTSSPRGVIDLTEAERFAKRSASKGAQRHARPHPQDRLLCRRGPSPKGPVRPPPLATRQGAPVRHLSEATASPAGSHQDNGRLDTVRSPHAKRLNPRLKTQRDPRPVWLLPPDRPQVAPVERGWNLGEGEPHPSNMLRREGEPHPSNMLRPWMNWAGWARPASTQGARPMRGC